ncbi:MAG TPA: tRNA pseudouridine(13) synthase TruD, partial [Thermodesulfobacteriota bacterium]
ITCLRDYPKDFVRAVNLVNPRLLSIFIAAYQSYLWNEMAKEFVKLYISQSELMRFYNSAVEMFFYKSLPVSLFQEFLSVLIPLVDHKVEFRDLKIRKIARRVIEQEGVEIENFRLNKIKRAFFKSVLRKVIAIPEELKVSETSPDEINTGKFKLTISFELPSGSYASVLIRRLGVV